MGEGFMGGDSDSLCMGVGMGGSGWACLSMSRVLGLDRWMNT